MIFQHDLSIKGKKIIGEAVDAWLDKYLNLK